jgi:hypothetical protein
MTSPDSADDARRRGHSRPSAVLAVVLAGAAVTLGIVAVVARTSRGSEPASRAAVWIDHAGVHLDGRTFALRVSSPTVLTLTSAGAVYGTAHDYWLQPRDGAARRIPVDGVPTGDPDGSVVGWVTRGRPDGFVLNAYDVATGRFLARHRFATGFRFAGGEHARTDAIAGVLAIDASTAYFHGAGGRVLGYDWVNGTDSVVLPRDQSPVVDIDNRVRVVPISRPAANGTVRLRFERRTGAARTRGVKGFPSASGLSPDGRSYLSGGFRGSPHGGFAPPVVFDTSTGHARQLEVGTGTTSGVAWGYDRSIIVASDVIAPNDAYVRTNVWICGVGGSCARIGTVDRVDDLLLPGGPA